MKQLFPMKQLRCLLAALLVLTLSSCSYDDSDLWNSVNGLSERLDQLENSMQEDINSLKSLLEKLNQQEVTVDSAVETADGWTVTFSDGTTVTIARGGSDNWSPVLVIVEEAGDFWWAYRNAEGDTVRLTDAEGNPIPAAAVAPRVRINPETATKSCYQKPPPAKFRSGRKVPSGRTSRPNAPLGEDSPGGWTRAQLSAVGSK